MSLLFEAFCGFHIVTRALTNLGRLLGACLTWYCKVF